MLCSARVFSCFFVKGEIYCYFAWPKFVATEEITLTNTIIFYKALITLSATKERKHKQFNKCACLCDYWFKFQDKQLFSVLTVLNTRDHNNGYNKKPPVLECKRSILSLIGCSHSYDIPIVFVLISNLSLNELNKTHSLKNLQPSNTKFFGVFWVLKRMFGHISCCSPSQ